jgi:hypothetical protein
MSKVPIAKAEHDKGKGAKAEGGNPETVDEHIKNDLSSEDTTLDLYLLACDIRYKSQME